MPTLDTNFARHHVIDSQGHFCTGCDQDAVTCQRCGQRVCGSLTTEEPMRTATPTAGTYRRFGNVCPKCKTK